MSLSIILRARDSINLLAWSMSRPRSHKTGSRKGLTDPFQVFCLERRPETTALNPGDSAGAITSLLAKLWRSMTPAQRLPYAELARKFDTSRSAFHTPAQICQSKPREIPWLLPSLYVVQRSGFNEVIQETSFLSLVNSMAEGQSQNTVLE
jgi:hypothetical protein